VQLNLPTLGLDAYTSSSQRARIATESWAATNLYCPNCTCNTLTVYAAGKPALDYACESVYLFIFGGILQHLVF
jgi:type II restriction enzyme